jgi:hypothetical protein
MAAVLARPVGVREYDNVEINCPTWERTK